MSLVSNVQAKKRTPLLQVLKSIGAAVIAWFIAIPLFHTEIPVFAAIAAIIVVQPSINASLGKALERSTGTVIGVAIALLASMALGAPSWLVLVAIAAAILVGWAFKLTPATANQIAISAMLAIAIGAATPEYALNRILETILGALVGIAINAVIVPPVHTEAANKAVAELGGNIAQVLEDLGAVLSRRTSYEVLNEIYWRARGLRPELTTTQNTIKTLQDSLRFNARKSRHTATLQQDAELTGRLAILVNRIIGISRATRDHYDDSLLKETSISEISEQLTKAGHDLRVLVRDAGLPAVAAPHPPTQEVPLLTAPIKTLKRPTAENWVLVGFLIENLRLVHAEITGAADELD